MKLPLSVLLLITFHALAQQSDSSPQDSSKIKNVILQEISVKAKVPGIEIRTDKIVLNVDAMSNAAGLNVLELLRTAPGVSVDGQDNIKMSGKSGVQVLIDGRLQTLSGQQVASVLKGMDAANIKTIEVIANPSAKYDAAGNAGIINIVLKKSSQDGTNGSVSAGYQKMEHFRETAALNLNNKTGAFNYFVNGNYANSLQFTKVATERFLIDKTFLQSGVERQGYQNPGLRAGVDYKINKKSSFGTILSYNRLWDDFPSDALTFINSANSDLLQTSTLANLTENKLATNLNYQFADTSGHSLKLDADWLGYQSALVNRVQNLLRNSGIKSRFDNDTETDINLFSAKVDYSHKLGKESNFDTGIKFSASKTANILQAQQSTGLNPVQAQLNVFNYRERIYAGYGNYQTSWKKWSLQTGLRAEYSKMKVLSVSGSQNISALPDTSYLKLFPTFFLRYKASADHAFGFSYSRRIDRPSFQDQNPYIYRIDFYNSNQGNPLLLPQFTNAIEVDYTYKSQTQFKLKCSQSRDLIEFVTSQTGDQAVGLPVNAGVRSFINFSVSSPFKINKVWSGYINAEPYYQFYKADLSEYSGLAKVINNGAGFNGYWSNNLALIKGLDTEVSSWFNYASSSSVYETKAISSVDVSIRKQLLKQQMTLRLAVRDVFNTQRWAQSSEVGAVRLSSVRKWESQGIYVGLNYRFGNQKAKTMSKEAEATDEEKRIKGRN